MAFKINNRSKCFSEQHYPDLDNMSNFIHVSNDEQKEIIRIYLTEGIPFIFFRNPILYEKIRTFLGQKLEINPKSISITGSGRLGYSLSPLNSKFGKPFEDKKSDLDFFIIDECWFNKLTYDFNVYKDWLNTSPILDEKTLTRYRANRTLIEKNLTYGFIDQDKLPDMTIFNNTKYIYAILRDLLKIMGNSVNCPQPKDASIRVYRDWQSCIDRISLNVKSAVSENTKS